MTFGKFHDMIILKIQASHENGIDTVNSIWSSKIVDVNGMAPEIKISEEKDIKKE